jgi:hypothetical protein
MLDEGAAFTLVALYILLDLLPGRRAVLVGNANRFMDGLVNLLAVRRTNLYPRFIEDVFHMP